MRKLLFILFILFSSSLLFAQQVELKRKWAVSLTGAFVPLPYLNFGLQPGIEYRFSERVSLLTDFTFRIGNKNSNDSDFLNKKYFRVKPELRYWIPGKTNRREYYLALQGSYSFRKFDDNGSFFYDGLGGDSVYYFERASVNSPVTTISLQVGSDTWHKKRVSVDFFMGFGIRFVNTQYSDVVNPQSLPRIRAKEWYGYTNGLQQAGHSSFFHFNTGIRISYHFE